VLPSLPPLPVTTTPLSPASLPVIGADARGRGIVSKWPVITLELGKFVREYRDKGFALREIRPMLIKAFGPRILKVVQEPRPYRGKDKAAAAEAAASTASASKKTAAKKTATKKTAAKTAATTTSSKKKTRRAS
jgi:hypothetical protein